VSAPDLKRTSAEVIRGKAWSAAASEPALRFWEKGESRRGILLSPFRFAEQRFEIREGKLEFRIGHISEILSELRDAFGISIDELVGRRSK